MSKNWFAVALAIFAVRPVVAQTSDLNGSWRLNLSQSYLGSDHPERTYVLTKSIVQSTTTVSLTDTEVHVSLMNIPLPDSKYTTDIPTDGQEHEVTAAPPFPGMTPVKMQMKAEWQGGTLLITELGMSSFGLLNNRKRFFLSKDGSELIELIECHNRFMDTEQRFVFDRVR